MGVVDVDLHLPEEIFVISGIPEDRIQDKIKEALAVELFGEGKLSFGQAATLAERNKWDFMDVLRRSRVGLVDYSANEIEEDLQKAQDSR